MRFADHAERPRYRRTRYAFRRMIEREGAAFADGTFHADLAAEQTRDFAADRQSQTGTAELTRRSHIGLLERFEDHVELVGRNADAGVGHRERDRRTLDGGETVLFEQRDFQRYAALGGELECVGKQVLENLLQSRCVGNQFLGDVFVALDREIQRLVGRNLTERAGDVVLDRLERNLLQIDRRRARFDLRQVEDVVDERQQVGTRGANRLRELDLLVRHVAVGVVGQLLGKNQQRVERRAQLVGHVCQELRLVFGRKRELLGLLFELLPRFVDLARAPFDFFVPLLQEPRTFFQLVVGLLQLHLLALQLVGQRLRLLEQLFGPHRCADRVQDDADRFGQLIEELQLRLVKPLGRRQLDDGFDLAFKQHRQYDQRERLGFAQTRSDGHVVRRHFG